MKNVNVVLIHGTFAPNAPWTQGRSRFRRQLQVCLKKQGFLPTFYTPQWPGWPVPKFNNSHRHRLRARSIVAKQIYEIRKVNSDPIVLVAHSHGGNVALYAARDEYLSVDGVACLSTPFIVCEERDGNVTSRFLVALLAPVYFVPSTLGAYFLLDRIGAPTFLAWLMPCLGLPIWKRLNNWVLLRVMIASGIRVAKLKLAELPPERLFIAATAWDEAAAWLAVIDFIASVPQRVASPKTAFWLTGIGLVSACAFDVYLLRSGARLEDIVAASAVVFPACFALWLTIHLLASVGVAFLSTIFRGAMVSYGGESPLMAIMTTIQIRKTPPNIKRWRGYVVPGKGLAHSRLYEDPDVIHDIADWIVPLASNPRPFVSAPHKGILYELMM